MVSPAVASLLALLAAIVLSCTSQLNVGLLAMALAWLIGVFVAGWPADAVAGGFPTQLFLTLAGVQLVRMSANSCGSPRPGLNNPTRIPCNRTSI